MAAHSHSWAMQAVVVRMLSDSKLEVREVAATTLSGLLKGAKADEAARLRTSFLADVDRLLPRNRKRQKAKAGIDPAGALCGDVNTVEAESAHQRQVVRKATR